MTHRAHRLHAGKRGTQRFWCMRCKAVLAGAVAFALSAALCPLAALADAGVGADGGTDVALSAASSDSPTAANIAATAGAPNATGRTLLQVAPPDAAEAPRPDSAQGEGASDGIPVAEAAAVSGSASGSEITAPSVAFSINGVHEDAQSVPVAVSLPSGYDPAQDGSLTLTVYQMEAAYEDNFADALWEMPEAGLVTVAVISDAAILQQGLIDVPLLATKHLAAEMHLGARLSIGSREYTSWTIPVYAADEDIPEPFVGLFNLMKDTAQGDAVRAICAELDLATVDLTNADLNQSVGYLAGWDGFVRNSEAYGGAGFSEDFLLRCNLPETSYRQLAEALAERTQGVLASTASERYEKKTLEEVIQGSVQNSEQGRLRDELQQMVDTARRLDPSLYTGSAWDRVQDALNYAEGILEPTANPNTDQLKGGYDQLAQAFEDLTSLKRLQGHVRITTQLQQDGSYTLTASLEDASPEGVEPVFAWGDGSGATGSTLRNVSPGSAGAIVVTVLDGRVPPVSYGRLTAQLAVPDKPQTLIATVAPGKINLVWSEVKGDSNKPAPDFYRIELYQGDNLVQTAKVEAKAPYTYSFSNLPIGAYTAKVCAINAAGRGDKVSVDAIVRIAAPTDSGAGAGAGGSGDGTGAGAGAKPGSDLGGTGADGSAANGRQSLADAVITVPAQTYTSHALTPVPTVKLAGKTLKAGTDYTVSYKNNIEVGTATIMVTAKSAAYTDSKSATFKIGHRVTVKTFKDLKSSQWYLKSGANAGTFASAGAANTLYLDYAVARGIINGYASGKNKGRFAGDGAVTRGQVAVMLYRADKGRSATTAENNVKTRFKDVPKKKYYTAAVKWAASKGIVTGYTSGKNKGKFLPNASVTRQDLAVMVQRYVKAKGVAASGKALAQKDKSKVSKYAKPAVQWAVAAGALHLRAAKAPLSPKSKATRAETAQMIAVALHDVLGQRH